MVNFVKPNYLPEMNNFLKIFKKPIEEGQYKDSTNDQIQLMNERCELLHSILQPIIQRRSNAVLLEQLPIKNEYIIFIKMTGFQKLLYNALMEKKINMPLLTVSAFCRKILNNPDLLSQSDIDDDIKEIFENDNFSKETVNGNWFTPLRTNYKRNVLKNSPKMKILLSILFDTLRTEDKIIVFSLSTATLNLLEYHLQTNLHLVKDWTFLRKLFLLPYQSII